MVAPAAALRWGVPVPYRRRMAKADAPIRLPPVAAIRAHRAAAREVEVRFTAEHPIEELYPYLLQVDLINRAIGSSPVEYVPMPHPETAAPLFESTARKSGMAIHYTELPYEWIPERLFLAEMFFPGGPIPYLAIRFEIDPATREIRIIVAYDSKRFRFIKEAVTSLALKGIRKVLRQVDAKLPKAVVDPLGIAGFADGDAAAQRRGAELAAAWGSLAPGSPIPAALAAFVATAPDTHVSRMRPYAVARQLDLPREDVLRFCLQAVTAGFLDLSWDLICPGCRGAKLRTGQLSELQASTHCDSCNLDYGADFSRNVEISFRPAAKVRVVGTGEFCLHAPSHLRHVASQLNVDPGATRTVQLPLPPGHYRLRGSGVGGEVALDVVAGAPTAEVRVAIGEGIAAGEAICGPDLTLVLENSSLLWQTIRVERHAWREDAATAAEVTSLQDFRDQFSHQVLRPGLQIGVSNIVILFSDLKDSTVLYESAGDAPAFSLVQSHFDIMMAVIGARHGAIIKTIGDAVMAAFTTVEDALQAGLEILEAFERWNASHGPGEQIVVKLGLNAGPCIALTLNDKLDYFGSTVNRAARVQGLAGGNELLMPTAFLDLPAVRQVMASQPLALGELVAELKGVSGRHRLAVVKRERSAVVNVA